MNKTLREKFEEIETRTSNIYFRDERRQSKKSEEEINKELAEFKIWLINCVKEYNKEVLNAPIAMVDIRGQIKKRQEELL